MWGWHYVAVAMDLDNYKTRQEDEVDFLEAVFSNPGDFQDLRKNDTWKVSWRGEGGA